MLKKPVKASFPFYWVGKWRITGAGLRLTSGSSWLFHLECLDYFRIVLQSERLQQEIFRRARMSSDPCSFFWHVSVLLLRLCIWKCDFCFKLVSYYNTMEGKQLSWASRAAVCWQENLYLLVVPQGGGIILFSPINFCLFLLSFLHIASFQHRDTASLCFLTSMKGLVVLQSTHCECLYSFWSPFCAAQCWWRAVPSRHLSFLLSSAAWSWLISATGSQMLHMFLICMYLSCVLTPGNETSSLMSVSLVCFAVILLLEPDSVLIHAFFIWKRALPILQCSSTAMPLQGQERIFLFSFFWCLWFLKEFQELCICYQRRFLRGYKMI